MYPHEMAALGPSDAMTDLAIPADSGESGPNMPMQRAEWTIGYTLVMFAMWWLMMVAMMLPSAAPMVLLYAAITRRGLRQENEAASTGVSNQVVVATLVFIGGYLTVWGAFSVAAVAGHSILGRTGLLSPTMASTSDLLGATLLLAAGIWQLTSIKTACLHHCRSPISFLSAHWRPGVCGAFRTGVHHGAYCLGCCWFLMALLFYGGIMNLIWILGLALFVLVEKTLPVGVGFGKTAGLLLIAWGLLLATATR